MTLNELLPLIDTSNSIVFRIVSCGGIVKTTIEFNDDERENIVDELDLSLDVQLVSAWDDDILYIELCSQ